MRHSLYKTAQVYRLGEYLYVAAPDGRSLVKAGKRNYRESTEWTDDKGRKWQFNEKTRRWGLHPDSKKTKGKKSKAKSQPELKPLFDAVQETSDRFDATVNESKQLLEGLNRAADEIGEEGWDGISIESIEADDRLMRERAKELFGIDDAELDAPDPEEDPEFYDISLDDLEASEAHANRRLRAIGAKMHQLKGSANNIVPIALPTRELRRKMESGEHRIVPFKKGDRSAYTRLIQDWRDEMDSLAKLAGEARMVIDYQKGKDALTGFLDGIKETLSDLDELGKKFHQERVENLERIFNGRIDRLQARIAASNKRLFEIFHPGKTIKVPKGTTQREYADIARKMQEGDKATIKQYSGKKLKPKSKKKKPAPQPKKKSDRKKKG